MNEAIKLLEGFIETNDRLRVSVTLMNNVRKATALLRATPTCATCGDSGFVPENQGHNNVVDIACTDCPKEPGKDIAECTNSLCFHHGTPKEPEPEKRLCPSHGKKYQKGCHICDEYSKPEPDAGELVNSYSCDDCEVALDCNIVVKAPCQESFINECKNLLSKNKQLTQQIAELQAEKEETSLRLDEILEDLDKANKKADDILDKLEAK